MCVCVCACVCLDGPHSLHALNARARELTDRRNTRVRAFRRIKRMGRGSRPLPVVIILDIHTHTHTSTRAQNECTRKQSSPKRLWPQHTSDARKCEASQVTRTAYAQVDKNHRLANARYIAKAFRELARARALSLSFILAALGSARTLSLKQSRMLSRTLDLIRATPPPPTSV